ncbi:hypothetical protein NKK48_29040 [Mesorhizobium sp. C386A]|uniref:hypothetical protein n=1 Tax=unclassified Mesorhizobium TaxID=325217 RepID=UPI0018DBA74F|nr:MULTISPECIES: hypothetical protein [unclassified Mesorhizobium]
MESVSEAPPFLFLFRTDKEDEISAQQEKVTAFFLASKGNGGPGPGGKIVDPPPPVLPENDLVVLVGGVQTTDGDSARFTQLKNLIGADKSLLVIDPWKDSDQKLEWKVDLEGKLRSAKSPLLVEHVGQNGPISDVDVFSDYLLLSVASRPGGGKEKLALVQSIVESTSRQRIVWKPAGAELKKSDGAEVSAQSPADFAQVIRVRLGLDHNDAAPAAYVATEEVVINRKLDGKLRKALKKHLSIIVGGDGTPPSNDCVVPFSFQLATTGDPLHRAVERFRPSQPNIVAACDISRGGRPLIQYLTEISGRVREGVNSYFSAQSDREPICILHILVMIEDLSRLDLELVDKANGNWRVVKFRHDANDEYIPDGMDVETAQGWVNDQLAEMGVL